MQNWVTVSHTVCAHVEIPRNFWPAGPASPYDGACLTPRNAPPRQVSDSPKLNGTDYISGTIFSVRFKVRMNTEFGRYGGAVVLIPVNQLPILYPPSIR